MVADFFFKKKTVFFFFFSFFLIKSNIFFSMAFPFNNNFRNFRNKITDGLQWVAGYEFVKNGAQIVDRVVYRDQRIEKRATDFIANTSRNREGVQREFIGRQYRDGVSTNEIKESFVNGGLADKRSDIELNRFDRPLIDPDKNPNLSRIKNSILPPPAKMPLFSWDIKTNPKKPIKKGFKKKAKSNKLKKSEKIKMFEPSTDESQSSETSQLIIKNLNQTEFSFAHIEFHWMGKDERGKDLKNEIIIPNKTYYGDLEDYESPELSFFPICLMTFCLLCLLQALKKKGEDFLIKYKQKRRMPLNQIITFYKSGQLSKDESLYLLTNLHDKKVIKATQYLESDLFIDRYNVSLLAEMKRFIKSNKTKTEAV